MKKAWGDNNTKYRIETDNGPDVEDIVHAHDEIDKEFDSEKLKEMIFHLVGKMPAESVHPILQRKLNELQKPKRFFGSVRRSARGAASTKCIGNPGDG